VSRDIVATLELPQSDGAGHVVPMGVDVDAIQRSIGRPTPIPGRFLFIGRLAESKGVDVLIRALARVSDATVVIVGDGPGRVTLEGLARREGVESRVRFRGTLPRSGVIEELRLAHALVIPSRVARGGEREGTPLVMGEAMAAGIPVIASRLGGLAEQIESGVNGLLVEPGSVASLADALRRALADPEAIRSCAHRAAETVKEALEISTTRRRYEEFLEGAARSESVGRETQRPA
jgi:glycosyltransferase involved in cell wall biosynthesis